MSAFDFSTLLLLFFNSNCAVLVRAQGTLATPLLEHKCRALLALLVLRIFE